MKEMYIIVPLITILICGMVPLNAEADSGTDTIHEDYYVAHPISFSSGEYIYISYTMTVTDGPHIDVYFVDSQNYQYYHDSVGFDYYVAMSDENTIYASNKITLYEHDTYYLIFDNTDTGTDPPWNMVDDVAYVDYTINSDITYSGSNGGGDGIKGGGTEFLIILMVIIFVVILIIGLLVWITSTKKGDNISQDSGVNSQQQYQKPNQYQSQSPQQTSYQQQSQQPPITQPPSESQKENKFCTNCGKQIPFNSVFCPYCAHRL